VHELRAGVHELHRERCLACGRCVAECFAGALELAGRRMVAADVLAQIVADAPYYRHSGGGATFSGGEPLLQREFLTCLLAGCRERGVHTAVETAGNYPWEWLAGALPLIDLVMYDIKVLDPGLHARHVGNDGRRSRANYRRLAASGKPLIVRTPVVGGVNDTPEHIGAIARFVAAHGEVLYFELLPYHALGDAKRQSLGRPPAAGFGTPSSAALAALAAAARAHVSRVRP